MNEGGPIVPPLVTRSHWMALAAVAGFFFWAGLWIVFGTIPRKVDGRGVVLRDSEFGIIKIAADHAGMVTEVFVKEGDIVEAGGTIATLQPEKGDRKAIRTLRGGKVIEVIASPGTVLERGGAIARMESVGGNYEALIYVSALEGKRVKVGMEARIKPISSSPVAPFLHGRVSYVSAQPVTQAYLDSELGGNRRLADWLLGQGASTEVVVDLARDSDQPDGYAWSRTGATARIESGLLLNGEVIFDRVRPITWFFSSHRE